MPPRRIALAPDIAGLSDPVFVAAGGHGDVFRYRWAQAASDRPDWVAVKVSADLPGSEAATWIEREAQVMSLIGPIPGIVPLLGSGQTGDGRAYLIIEYCDGSSMKAMLEAKPSLLTPFDILEIGTMAARALDRLHRSGVVHRDIKPGNLMLRNDGGVTILDFGLAARIGEPNQLAIATSPRWAGPELSNRPAPVDPRSDIYGLAAVLYAACAGRAPFELPNGPNSPAHLRSRAMRERPEGLGQLAPSGLEAVLFKALERDLQARYATAGAFASVLEQVAGQLGPAQPKTSMPDAAIEAARINGTGRRGVVGEHSVLAAGQMDDSTLPAPAWSGGDWAPDDLTEPATPVVLQPDLPRPSPSPAQDRSPWPASKTQPTTSAAGKTNRAPAKGEVKSQRRQLATWFGAVGLVLAVALFGIITALRGPAPATPLPQGHLDSAAPAAPQKAVPAPVSLQGQRVADTVTFTWVNPSPANAVWYEVIVQAGTAEPVYLQRDQTSVVLEGDLAAGLVCVEVSVVRHSDSRMSSPTKGCVS